MSFQVGIGSVGGTAFFQVGLCTFQRTVACVHKMGLLGLVDRLQNYRIFLAMRIGPFRTKALIY